MRRTCTKLIAIVAVALAGLGAVGSVIWAAEAPRWENQLPPKLAAEGWIMLFDGATTFGWAPKGECNCEVADKALTFKSGTGWMVTTTEFSDYALKMQYRLAGDGKSAVAYGIARDGDPSKAPKKKELIGTGGEWRDIEIAVERTRGAIAIQSAPGLSVRNVLLRPTNLKPIFFGDQKMKGWKPLPGYKSKFSVTPEGWLNIRDGGGDIQTEEQWRDFCCQLDIYSSSTEGGKPLNSGVFFRAEPGKFWQGYEAQIRNEWKDNDRTKPVDFGTGAIYNRQPTRAVIPNEREWYTMTIIAAGNHLSTWVNGYQTTDYTDTNPPGPPRQNKCRVEGGVITLQGHDPTTNMFFRNIKVAEYPEVK